VVGGSRRNAKQVVIAGASATVFVGGSDVTSTAGLPVTTTTILTLDLQSGDDLYAIASTGSPTVNVLALT